MEWKLLNEAKYRCPCGKGKIIASVYINDCMEIAEKKIIDCPECSLKYNVESFKVEQEENSQKSEKLFCVKKNYPEFKYIPIANDFDEILIRLYPLKQLEEFLTESERYKNSEDIPKSRISYVELVNRFKNEKNMVELLELNRYLKLAVRKYSISKINYEFMLNEPNRYEEYLLNKMKNSVEIHL